MPLQAYARKPLGFGTDITRHIIRYRVVATHLKNLPTYISLHIIEEPAKNQTFLIRCCFDVRLSRETDMTGKILQNAPE